MSTPIDNTANYVNVTLAFLGRANLNGQEADTMVEVQRWLRSLAAQASAKAPAEAPAKASAKAPAE
jgi:hypothetical protein